MFGSKNKDSARVFKSKTNGLPVVKWLYDDKKVFSGIAASRLRSFYKANDVSFRDFVLRIQDTECGLNNIAIRCKSSGTRALDDLISAFFSVFKEVKAGSVKYITARGDVETVEVGVDFGGDFEVGGVVTPHRIILENGQLAEDKDWILESGSSHRNKLRKKHSYEENTYRA